MKKEPRPCPECGHCLDREHDYKGFPWAGARCGICRRYCS
jgi:endogenous inhibitor of DNA gyrase (YacG/DUF329 family)